MGPVHNAGEKTKLDIARRNESARWRLLKVRCSDLMNRLVSHINKNKYLNFLFVVTRTKLFINNADSRRVEGWSLYGPKFSFSSYP